MLEIRELNELQIKEIFETQMKLDFPPDELKPLRNIIQMLREGMYECLGLYEGDMLYSYAYFVCDRESGYRLLDYLAVCREYRSGGYGSKFMQKIHDEYPESNGLFIECESLVSAKNQEETEIRARRIRFYLGNGAVETSLKSSLFGVEYTILYFPVKEELQREQAMELLACIYDKMFSKLQDKSQIRWWEEVRV